MDTEMEIKNFFAGLAENPGTLKIAGFCARNAHRLEVTGRWKWPLFCKITNATVR